MQTPNSNEMFCLVCAEPGAGRHYGSLCCSGCKGFFRRSIRTKRFYICSYNNDCLIRKEYRNCCRSCRMRKCLAVGMNPKLVHSDRGAMSNSKTPTATKQLDRQNLVAANSDVSQSSHYFAHDSPELPNFSPSNITSTFVMPADSTSCSSSNPNMVVCKNSPVNDDYAMVPCSTENNHLAMFSLRNYNATQAQRDSSLFLNSSMIMFDADKLPLGTKSWIPLFQRSNYDSVVQYYMSVDELLDRFSEHDHSHIFTPEHLFTVNSEIDLHHAFIEPRSIMGRTKIDWSLTFPIHGALNRIWLRVGMYYLDWMSHVPELKQLSFEDRMKLTANRSMACIWALVAQRSVNFSSKQKGIALSGGVFYPIDENIESRMDKVVSTSSIVKYLHTLTHFVWDNIVDPIRRMKVMDAELCILRILCLLSSVPGLSLEGREIIREAHAYYMTVMYKVVSEIVGSPEKASMRICELLTLLPSFEKAASIQDDSFSMMSIEDVNGLNNNIVSDYHLRKTYRT